MLHCHMDIKDGLFFGNHDIVQYGIRDIISKRQKILGFTQ